MKRRKEHWIGHILPGRCFLKLFIGGKVGRIGVTGSQRRRREQLPDGLKETRGSWKLKANALDHTGWRIHLGRSSKQTKPDFHLCATLLEIFDEMQSTVIVLQRGCTVRKKNRTLPGTSLWNQISVFHVQCLSVVQKQILRVSLHPVIHIFLL
jgi:hypothetical protein